MTRPADLRVRSLEIHRKADPREMVAIDTEPGLRSALRVLEAAMKKIKKIWILAKQ